MLVLDNGVTIETTAEGYLINLQDWSEAIASLLAQQDNLLLNEDHWQVLYFLRDFYANYNITPAIRILVKELAKKMGPEKGNSIYLNKLFPQGLLRQASKLAGLPKPAKCI